MKVLTTISAIVLAAGSSSRMGKAKQLLPWGDHTLLEHAISQAKGLVTDEVVVVLGDHVEEIRSQIDFDEVNIVVNRQFSAGMGSSIAKGAEYLLTETKPVEHVLVLLCDQPLVNQSYLFSMAEKVVLNDKGIGATAYKDQPGVPALFSWNYVPELAKLSGKHGARALIKAHSDDSILCYPSKPFADIDTEEDYQRLKSTYRSR